MNMNKKHLVIMLACCLAPLAALGAIFVFRVPVTGVVYLGLILLCPAMHLLMMRNMTHAPERSAGVGHDHIGQARDHIDSPITNPQLQNRVTAGERKG
jgi:hypothetical protein